MWLFQLKATIYRRGDNMELNIDLNEIICDTFVDVADDIINCNVNRAVLKGGRFSSKSQVAFNCIVAGCMIYKESAVACVKYANKIEERLVSACRSSIEYMGVEQFWKLRKSPHEYVLLDEDGKETQVSIKFTGADNPDGLKSYKPRRGAFRYIFFEEITDHKSYKDLNNLINTFARGETNDGKRTVIMCYNPPMSASSWVNKEYNAPIGRALGFDTDYKYTEFTDEVEPGVIKTIRQVIHHSTYLDVIESGHSSWLGYDRILEAKQQSIDNPKFYEWDKLGKVVGTDANVFWNIKNWDGNTDDLNITEVFRGLDHGYNDPTAYVEWYYDRKNKRIYALNEFYGRQAKIDDIAFEIRQYNKHNFPVYGDCASPTLNAELVNKGLNVLPSIKGADSIRAGIKWLQSLGGIYISPVLTPNIYREFTEYEWQIDKNDNVLNKLVEGAEHTIDATRYAFGLEIKYIT